MPEPVHLCHCEYAAEGWAKVDRLREAIVRAAVELTLSDGPARSAEALRILRVALDAERVALEGGPDA